MTHRGIPFITLLFTNLVLCAYSAGTTSSSITASTLDGAYPGVVSGALSFAVLEDLPAGKLLQSGKMDIGKEALDAEIAKIPEPRPAGLEKNRLFLLEQMATKDLLLASAYGEAGKNKDVFTTGTQTDLVSGYLRSKAAKATVTDKEIGDFYEKNKDMCGGAPLDQVRADLKDYVLQQKQQALVTEFIRTIGQRSPIKISAAWAREQASLAMDNPVDKARKSGRPTMVDFGADGCRPCDMMTPVLANLKNKYEGKANVQFVHVREQEILAARFGIESIPVQVFFDKNGKEVTRHVGFFPQPEIEKQMAAMGVR